MQNINVRADTGTCGIGTALVQAQGQCCAAVKILTTEFIHCDTLEVRTDPKKVKVTRHTSKINQQHMPTRLVVIRPTGHALSWARATRALAASSP